MEQSPTGISPMEIRSPERGLPPMEALRTFLSETPDRYPQHPVTTNIHDTEVRFWLPLSETNNQPENEAYYTHLIDQAIDKTNTSLGSFPPKTTYVFVESENDWDRIIHLTGNPVTRKENHKSGVVVQRNVVFTFARTFVRSEISDAGNVRSAAVLDKLTDRKLQRTVTHETAHVATMDMCHAHPPLWFTEGIAILVASTANDHRIMEKPPEAFDALQHCTDMPNDAYLKKEGLTYRFGVRFLDWTLSHTDPAHSSDSQSKWTPPTPERMRTLGNLLRIMENEHLPFHEAYKLTYGIDLDNAYLQFRSENLPLESVPVS